MKRDKTGPMLLCLSWTLSVWITTGCIDSFSSCMETHTCKRFDSDGGEGGSAKEENETATGGVDEGGGSGGADVSGAAEHLMILTEALPDATLGSSYEHFLVASGGTGKYVWSVSSGGLPPGLEITQDGTISGKPSTDGAFEFEVSAADEEGAIASRVLSLLVLQKRWLTYISDEVSAGEHRLYAVDVASGFAKSSLTSELEQDGDADGAWWSPDGAWLAYTVTTSADEGSMELRLVDMRYETPSASTLISSGEYIRFNELEWASDSKRFAYLVERPNDAFELMYVDVIGAEPLPPTAIGAVQRYGWRWIGDRFIASETGEGVAFYTRDRSTWSPAKSLPISPLEAGSFLKVDPKGTSAWFGISRSDCTGSFALIDFSQPSFEMTSLDLSPNPAMTLFAGFASHLDEIVVLKNGYLDATQVHANLGATADCEKHVWAPQGDLIATVDASDRLVLSKIDLEGDVSSVEVPGTYPLAQRIQFSANGELLTLDSGVDLFVSRIDNGIPQEIVRVNEDGGAIDSYQLAPDGSSIAYTVDQNAYVVTTAGNRRTVSPWAAAEGSVGELRWRADSQHLSFKARAAAGAALRLHVIDLSNARGKPQDLTPGLDCVEGVCEQVKTIEFQP